MAVGHMDQNSNWVNKQKKNNLTVRQVTNYRWCPCMGKVQKRNHYPMTEKTGRGQTTGGVPAGRSPNLNTERKGTETLVKTESYQVHKYSEQEEIPFKKQHIKTHSW